MNLNLFDNIDGLILREKENTFSSPKTTRNSVSNNTASCFPENFPLAMAYVPIQQLDEIYSEDEAFCTGTLFPELNFPFKGGCDNE